MRDLVEGEVKVVCRAGINKYGSKIPISCPKGFSCLDIIIDRNLKEEACDEPFITTWVSYLINKHNLIEVE